MENFKEYGWDDEISEEGGAFTLLPEGDYDFTVSKVERARHTGSEKVPACNMAKVTFTIWGAEDKMDITENYFLCNKFEWKLSALFLATGLKRHGEPLKMQWGAITGMKGKCRVYIDNYKKKDGSDGQSNKIKKLYAYDEAVNIATVQPTKTQHQQQTYQQPAQPQYQQPQGGWTPGNF